MSVSRFFHSIRFSRDHGSRSAAALTLAFALVAGLACDENAPTETRAASAPGAVGAADAPDLALGDITTAAIALPVNQSVATTAPAPAFRINQTGTGPNGIFQITRAGNTQSALQGLTNGRGRAGFFQITNTGSIQPALEARTNGGGRAGLFETTNSGNPQNALEARSNSNRFTSAFYAVTTGSGSVAATIDATNTTNPAPAVLIRHSGTGWGIQSEGTKAGNFLGNVHVQGNLEVTGTVSKGGGSFQIDHPLDPEHKYLSHSFVESPDMKNVYDGTAMLDGRGEAVVMLPNYFEALNRDFRYQLTAVGAPGPNLHISQKIRNNRFVIAGGVPGSEVSWQVTGVRQDAFAEAHRIQVESEKLAGR